MVREASDSGGMSFGADCPVADGVCPVVDIDVGLDPLSHWLTVCYCCDFSIFVYGQGIAIATETNQSAQESVCRPYFVI